MIIKEVIAILFSFKCALGYNGHLGEATRRSRMKLPMDICCLFISFCKVNKLSA